MLRDALGVAERLIGEAIGMGDLKLEGGDRGALRAGAESAAPNSAARSRAHAVSRSSAPPRWPRGSARRARR